MTRQITISEVAERSGVAPSALRFYEDRGLLTSHRDARGHRRYAPDALRRVAFITIGQSLGISLAEIASVLAELPADRSPTKRDWARVGRVWRDRLDARITQLETLRDRLTSCIGCGCLSLRTCALSNRQDRAAALGAGARYLLGDPVPAEPAPGIPVPAEPEPAENALGNTSR